jgi:uncharacterized membrane protein
MEAFSDGVIAILITVMVLELRVPAGTHWQDLHREASRLFTYVLSFVFLAIYWNNHHHMLKVTRRVNGLVLWADGCIRDRAARSRDRLLRSPGRDHRGPA